MESVVQAHTNFLDTGIFQGHSQGWDQRSQPSLGEGLRQVQLCATRGTPAGFLLRTPRSDTALVLRKGKKTKPRKKKK